MAKKITSKRLFGVIGVLAAFLMLAVLIDPLSVNNGYSEADLVEAKEQAGADALANVTLEDGVSQADVDLLEESLEAKDKALADFEKTFEDLEAVDIDIDELILDAGARIAALDWLEDHWEKLVDDEYNVDVDDDYDSVDVDFESKKRFDTYIDRDDNVDVTVEAEFEVEEFNGNFTIVDCEFELEVEADGEIDDESITCTNWP